MYGSRGRIGLMLPYDNAVIEPEFARTLPPGVSAHVVRTTKTDRMELAEESLMLAPNDAAIAREHCALCLQCQQLHSGAGVA